MKIVWDERKRLSNIAKHGLDFAHVDELDWQTALVEVRETSTATRPRFKAIGYFRDGTAAVVFATLGAEAISVISFRQASDKERRMLPWPRPKS
ncbi:BrnT family toxin [uncultured Agrobacterium sp.]|uniref:BrnT family toxin n=1 Tax=uncultured Agrobacterium sp. TaxID=157277 RepID=UPI00258BD720|nr:BrnT family toxin [uncultured Agrobacterium sp.]